MLTHRLTGDEISHDVLHTNADREPLSFLLAGPDYQRLTDGAPITEALPQFATRPTSHMTASPII